MYEAYTQTLQDQIGQLSKLLGDPPAGMLAMYEILHGRHIEDAATVKILQNMYLE